MGRWKAVPEGRKGTAEGRGCLGDGKAGAKTMGLERSHFPVRIKQTRTLGK